MFDNGTASDEAVARGGRCVMTGGMSPDEFQNYIGLLSRLLRLRATEREAIEEELRSHLEERLAALTAQGIEPARAISMALAEFGDAAALAAEFTAVSHFYKRRWIMRLTVGSIAASVIMAAMLIAYWPGGPVQLAQSLAQAQQTDKTKQLPAHDTEKLDVNAQTQAKLEKLMDAEFMDATLEQLMDYLANKTDVQFHFDKRSMNEAGISMDTPVTFRLKNVPAEMIMRLVFRDLDLAYYLDNGVLIVTTPDEAQCRLDTRLYRVSDLIDTTNEPASNGNTIMKSPPTSPDAEIDNKARASKNIPASSQYSVQEDYLDDLINLVTSTIRPTTWDSVGGPGSIAPYRGVLVISQTADIHREIQKFLDDLRKSIDKTLPPTKAKTKQSGTGDQKTGGSTVGTGGGEGLF